MSNEDSRPHTDFEIGRTLERARAERGLSLWQVEEVTKIRAKYLHDLERENFDVLPAVYVLGSLKTYADYLGLDGEALARDLKNRQAPPEPEQDPADEEPATTGRGGLLAALAGLFGSQDANDGEAAPATGAAHNPRLYLGLGAVLLLVLAVALVSILGGEGQPVISQVREAQTSEAPWIAFTGDTRDGGDAGRNQDNESADDRSGGQAKPPDKDAEKEEKDGAENEQNLAITPPTPGTASASASAPAASTPASTASASARPEVTAASTAPDRTSATAAPEDPSTPPADGPAPSRQAPTGTQGGSGQGRMQGGGLDASSLADGIFSRARSGTNFAR